MRFLRRHKSVLLALGIYWPFIFWLTHIPIPAIARQSGLSDKTMHVLAYFVLTFLAWFAVSPYEKVRWNTWKAWILWLVIVLYAAIDEYLQGRVGRSADVVDFAADVFGVVLGLGLLSILSFWPALLAASAVFIFVISNMSHLLMYPHYHLNTVFHFTAYTAFALIWIQYVERYTPLKPPAALWLFCCILVPVMLLVIIKATAPLWEHPIGWIEIATALFGISSSVLTSWATFKFFRKQKKSAAPF